MDMIQLIKPTAQYIPEIERYRKEFFESGDSMDGTGDLKNIPLISDWIERNRSYEHKEFLPPNYVTAELFLAVRTNDNKVVGMIQLRHELNDFLFQYGGHIGYSLCPSERRKGYAKEMLRQCLLYCRTRGMDRVLISCLEDNVASRKTILSQGGVYEDTRYLESDNEYLQRYWIDLTKKS